MNVLWLLNELDVMENGKLSWRRKEKNSDKKEIYDKSVFQKEL